jgi:hypothetical protein
MTVYLTATPSDQVTWYVIDTAGNPRAAALAQPAYAFEQDYDFKGFRTLGNCWANYRDASGSEVGATGAGAGGASWSASPLVVEWFSTVYPANYKVMSWEIKDTYR